MHQRLAEVAVHLAAQQVEIVRRGGAVGDLHIVLRAELEEALGARRAVLGALAFIAVRQQHHEAVGAQPLGLARRDELVDHDLRAVDEIAELRLPQHQRLGIGRGIAIFEAEHAIFGQRAVEHFEIAVRDRLKRHVFVLVILIDPHRMTLAEGAAARILAREADAEAFGEQRAERQRLAGRPVEILARLEHVALGVEDAREGLVDLEALGNLGQRAAEAVEQLLLDAGIDAAARGLGIGGRAEAGPAAGEPVRLVGQIGLARLELAFEQGRELVDLLVDEALIDHALGGEALGIDLADRRMLADRACTSRAG